jgi:Bacterial protein of unknown function (DUF894).
MSNSAWSTLIRPLRHRNFRLFASGQLISLIGTWVQNVSEAWLVYRLTGSSAALGLVRFAGLAPVFVLALIGGILPTGPTVATFCSAPRPCP